MAPRNIDSFAASNEDDEITTRLQQDLQEQNQELSEPKRPPMQIVWRNVIWLLYLHLAGLYGLYLLPSATPTTMAWTVLCYYMSALGITAGAHRLWAHKTYKAALPLRIFLAFCQSMAFQNDIIEWSRDHRVHHKYSETEADPHNAKRGFFFAHCGWLLVRKHPEVKSKGKLLDMSDLLADPVCAVQRKLYLPSVVLVCFVFPAVVPWYLWGENGFVSFFVCSIVRYLGVLHFTWCVNSVAHLFGNKPYDRNINPSENIIVTIGAAGEGFHNFHHTFPQDYQTSEFGMKYNVTSMFINAMAFLGQATDCKTVSAEMIKRRMQRTGDGTTGFGFLPEADTQKTD